MDRKKYLAIGFVMLATVIIEPAVAQKNTVAKHRRSISSHVCRFYDEKGA